MHTSRRLLCATALVAGLGYAAAAQAAYFTDSFASGTPDSSPLGSKASYGGAASTDPNLAIYPPRGQDWGIANVYADNGTVPTGILVPSVKLFPALTNNTLLSLGAAYVGTTSGYQDFAAGGHDVNFQLTAHDATPISQFGFGETLLAALYLRESAVGANDGLMVRLYTTGEVNVWDVTGGTATGPIVTNQSYFAGPTGLNATDVFDVKIRDTGSSLAVFVNGTLEWTTSNTRTYGNTNAGFIEIGQEGYNVTKYSSFGVTAVPEPATVSLLIGGTLGLLARRRQSYRA